MHYTYLRLLCFSLAVELLPSLALFELPPLGEVVVPVELLAKPDEGAEEEPPPPPAKKGK